LVAHIERTIRGGGLVLALALLAFAALAAEARAGQGGLSSVPTAEAPALPPSGVSRQVFPVRGPHEYWDGFGAGRGHEGVDIGSPCGTPLVAVSAGRVRFNKFHPRAGNYLVLDLKGTLLDVAYMHLREPAPVRPGQVVAAGQPIGLVGDTGNASGCHLHFEVWDGPYYGGGTAIDPMPLLESWDNAGKRPRQRSR